MNPVNLVKFCLCLLISLSGVGKLCAQGLDSLTRNALNAKLQEYFEALKYEDLEVQKAECDFLIETTEDSLVRQFVAQTIFDHYMDSKIMGAESVAVYLIDNWYIPGKVQFNDEMTMLSARMFAEFNRQSLIGMSAPQLEAEDLNGNRHELFAKGNDDRRFKVIYFYDTDCASCRMETILLRNTIETEDFPIHLYAFYVGDDKKQWQDYVTDRLTPHGGRAVVTHIWDPSYDSDYQRKYGVLKTPQMYLIAPDGTIIGRGLDTQALSQMLHGIFDEVKLEYGGAESESLYDGIFMSEDKGPTKDEVVMIAEYIASSTLARGDTVMYRQMTGDLLYYLATHSGEGMKEGLSYLIDNHILTSNEVWRTQDDSLKVVGFAQIMNDLLSKAEPGTRIADIKVPGELFTYRKSKNFDKSLRKVGADTNIIIFFTEGCDICKAEKEAASTIISPDVNVLHVNVDQIMRTNPRLASRLFDAFDLSALPFIIETDRKGIILRRYITLR